MKYQDALSIFFNDVSVGYEENGGLPWIEIDFPEDVQRAVSQAWSAIEASEESGAAVAVWS